MYYPFKERQYSLLPSFPLVENLAILKCECRVPARSASGRCCPCARASEVFAARVDGHGLETLPGHRGCGAGGRGQDPCSDARQISCEISAFSGVRQQGWKYKLGNQVKPLHGCRSSAHTLLSCSLECATCEALADCGIHLIIFFTY